MNNTARAMVVGFVIVVIIGVFLFLNNTPSMKYYNVSHVDDYEAVLEEMNNEGITITFTTDKEESYDQVKYHIEGSTLYIGVQFSYHAFEDDLIQTYTYLVETEENITKIILKGPHNEKVLWEQD